MCLVSNSLPRQLFAYLRYLFLEVEMIDASSPHTENSIYPSRRRATPRLHLTRHNKSTIFNKAAYFKISFDYSKRSVVV